VSNFRTLYHTLRRAWLAPGFLIVMRGIGLPRPQYTSVGPPGAPLLGSKVDGKVVRPGAPASGQAVRYAYKHQ